MRLLLVLSLSLLGFNVSADPCYVGSFSHYTYASYEEEGGKVLKETLKNTEIGDIKIIVVASLLNKYRYPYYSIYCVDGNGNHYLSGTQNTSSEVISSTQTAKAFNIQILFPSGDSIKRSKIQFLNRGYVLEESGALKKKSIFEGPVLSLNETILATSKDQISNEDYIQLEELLKR